MTDDAVPTRTEDAQGSPQEADTSPDASVANGRILDRLDVGHDVDVDEVGPVDEGLVDEGLVEAMSGSSDRIDNDDIEAPEVTEAQEAADDVEVTGATGSGAVQASGMRSSIESSIAPAEPAHESAEVNGVAGPGPYGLTHESVVGSAGAKPAGGSRVRLLEREGEVAADFLEKLLDIADLDGDIEVDIDGDRASVAIVDSEDGRVPRRLVGSDGKVLDALQELTRLAVQEATGERSRLMLDIAGHRAERRAAVIEIAHTVIAEVKTTGAKKALDDMSAFERKIVHDEVAAAGLESESDGVEPHRHIVVFPT